MSGAWYDNPTYEELPPGSLMRWKRTPKSFWNIKDGQMYVPKSRRESFLFLQFMWRNQQWTYVLFDLARNQMAQLYHDDFIKLELMPHANDE